MDFEGQPVTAYEGEPLAVALFASGVGVLSRSIKFHRPRGFFCLAGDCAACLMRVDGRPNIRACRVPVRAGLRCERQNAWPSAGLDLLETADLFFPESMDHHGLMTSPRALNLLLRATVRKLSGLGRLPDAAPQFESLPRAQARHVDLVVVGAGPAGLRAAAVVAERRPAARVLVLEAADRAGGSYLSHPDHGPEAAAAAQARALAAGVELMLSTQAVGWYPEDRAPGQRQPGLLCAASPQGLLKLTARRYLYATGAHDQNALFCNNDRPGVMAARACGLLLCTYGVLPGRQPVVLGDGPYARALAAALERAGAEARCVDGTRRRVVGVRGRSWVRAVEVVDAAGRHEELPCDLLAVAVLPAPASELPQQHGVAVDFARAGGFGAVCAPDGRTAVPEVFCAGDVAGFAGVVAAEQSGQAAGVALAAELGG